MEEFPTYLNPQTLAKIKELEITARRNVEGLVSGGHKSPFQGVSVEFAEHREYVPGDDVRHIDWKVYGKTDKFYLKRYEQETNLVLNLAIDTSESMKYGSAGVTKHRYACELAACLSYLILHQQDSVGVALFEDKVRYFTQPSGQPSTLKQILQLLSLCQPANLRSKIGGVLDELAARWNKRSLVAIISDGFDSIDSIRRGLQHLRHRRHEAILFHVLDPAELDFPFDRLTLFRGLENMPRALVEPRGLRQAYLNEFSRYRRELMSACRSANADYQLARTDEPIDRMLTAYLAQRAMRGAG